jgi:hypothetical protein
MSNRPGTGRLDWPTKTTRQLKHVDRPLGQQRSVVLGVLRPRTLRLPQQPVIDGGIDRLAMLPAELIEFFSLLIGQDRADLGANLRAQHGSVANRLGQVIRCGANGLFVGLVCADLVLQSSPLLSQLLVELCSLVLEGLDDVMDLLPLLSGQIQLGAETHPSVILAFAMPSPGGVGMAVSMHAHPSVHPHSSSAIRRRPSGGAQKHAG